MSSARNFTLLALCLVILTTGSAFAVNPKSGTSENDGETNNKRNISEVDNSGLVAHAFLYTPNKKNKIEGFALSPDSKSKSNSVYLIHDFKDSLNFKKVDFGKKEVSEEDLNSKFKEIRELAEILRSNELLYSFHRYVGKISENESKSRTALNRFKEHASLCNSVSKGSKKRLCLGLQRNASLNRHVTMTVVASNVHSNQLDDVESRLIDIWGGLEDLGWNSKSGHSVPNLKLSLVKKNLMDSLTDDATMTVEEDVEF
jgi:hypothetical protein